MKLRIHLPPHILRSPQALAAHEDARMLASTYHQDATGETFLIELHHLYCFRSALRTMSIAATAYHIELSPHPSTYRQQTSLALTRRIALIIEALLFLQDAHDTLHHFTAAETIFQVTLEALLLLLQTTQQQLRAAENHQGPPRTEEAPDAHRLTLTDVDTPDLERE